MHEIIVPGKEFFDNRTSQFFYKKEQKLVLEHSLVSISKWESKWKKPYFSYTEKTPEEMIDYVRCMTLTQNVNPDVYHRLTQSNIDEIVKYINDPMTATTISEIRKSTSSRSYTSSELIYYWMFSYNIPKECEKWHLNRLLTLIKIFNVEGQNGNKDNNMSQSEILEHNAKLNAEMRAKYHSKG